MDIRSLALLVMLFVICFALMILKRKLLSYPERKDTMKPDYKNWVPKGMVIGVSAGFIFSLATLVISAIFSKTVLMAIFSIAMVVLLAYTTLMLVWYNTFSYNGKRQMSRQIIEGISEYVKLQPDGIGLDVGCGSGALTIACAKRNPQGKMIGIDRWGKEYASFNKPLCESNAKAEGAENVNFQKGDALKLDFPDEYFDVVTSNYVYHNITGANKQDCLRETLRVLKKGGMFAIHDIMTKMRYGDMKEFAKELKESGYEKVELIDTTSGLFMTPKEAKFLGLSGSTLLVGKK